MPRRAAAQVRPLEADPIHRSKLVQQVINKVMLDGKKAIAERIVYDARAPLAERGGDISGGPRTNSPSAPPGGGAATRGPGGRGWGGGGGLPPPASLLARSPARSPGLGAGAAFPPLPLDVLALVGVGRARFVDAV